jgi:uncharacterized NAD(P)/FAD-binding protein YdhS
MTNVVVIGGGFCGTFCAAELATAARAPVAIKIIEPRATLGAGVAYSATDPAHRINVPAARMTLFPDNPLDFDIWVRRNGVLEEDPAALWPDGNAYPRREVFGRYVAERLAACERPGVSVAHVRDTVVGALRQEAGWRVRLAGGDSLPADFLVLAVSHPPPQPPCLIAALPPGRDIIANPWAPGALQGIDADDEAVIIGTGLTMADMVAALSRRGHRGRITAFSRRGQLSRGHAFVADPPKFFTSGGPAPETALGLSRQIRRFVSQAAARGLPWQVVLDDVRANAKPLWQALDVTERRRLLRHLRTFWDAHRYRVAPQVEQAVQARRADGSLTILAASLRGASRRDGRIELTLHPRMAPPDRLLTLRAEAVIITTGPAHGRVLAGNPVLADLARQQALQADPLGLGLAVDEHSRALDANGIGDDTLYVAGPLARERFGELMGLPQVAAQPSAVGRRIASLST